MIKALGLTAYFMSVPTAVLGPDVLPASFTAVAGRCTGSATLPEDAPGRGAAPVQVADRETPAR